jgi:protease I
VDGRCRRTYRSPRTSRPPAGEFVDGPDVVDGSMVSARGWEDLADFFKVFLELLERSAVSA